MAEERGFSFLVIIVPVVVLIVFVLSGIFLSQTILRSQQAQQLACTDEAMQCPDGSSVGRTGPSCEFAQCPAANVQGWNTFMSSDFGFTMQYPNNFFDAGYEPKVISSQCNSQGFPNTCPNPNNRKVIINGTTYCSYQTTDAAAGHTYYHDFYVTVKNQSCISIQLDSFESRCENYLPLQSGNTQQEQDYNTCVAKRTARPGILQQIVNTFIFTR